MNPVPFEFTLRAPGTSRCPDGVGVTAGALPILPVAMVTVTTTVTTMTGKDNARRVGDLLGDDSFKVRAPNGEHASTCTRWRRKRSMQSTHRDGDGGRQRGGVIRAEEPPGDLRCQIDSWSRPPPHLTLIGLRTRGVDQRRINKLFTSASADTVRLVNAAVGRLTQVISISPPHVAAASARTSPLQRTPRLRWREPFR